MKPATVDDYVNAAPKQIQEKLRQLRDAIRSIAPKAEEKISYAMPYYGYKGRLAYFSFARNHIGLYIPPPVIQDHASELKNYETATATVRFPLDQELPIPLIKKLVLSRMAINEEKSKKK